MVIKLISKLFNTERKVLCALLLLICQHLVSQNKEFTTNEGQYPVEKVYLHLSKTLFSVGEDIWFKIYLVDAKTNKPSRLSEMVYAELIDLNGNIIQKKTYKLKDGKAPGDFDLRLQAKKGIYILRAYTNYMRNFDNAIFFEKEIHVGAANGGENRPTGSKISITGDFRPDLQFFPEGGHMVNGFLNPVGFKATDSQGYGIPITGKIVDDKDKKIKEFSSSHLGMGLFHFIPKKGRSYSAKISTENQIFTYKLPIPLNEGALMTVVENDDYYKVNLKSTNDLPINGFTISGKQKNKTIFKSKIESDSQKNNAVVKIQKDILLEGIFELTLFDRANRPVAERLSFHFLKNSNAQSTILSSKSIYGPRSLVSLEIDLDKYDKKEIFADLSLAVNNTKLITDEYDAEDIKTYLLLSSELRGAIEQPGYYFYSEDPQRKKNLDLLMRTQGWRQYRLKNNLRKTETYFQPEKGFSISGKVISDFNSSEPLIGSVSLTSNNSEEMVQDKVSTDDEGNFIFKNLNFVDTTSILMNADVQYSDKKRKSTDNYKIVLDSLTSPKILSKSSKSTLLRPPVAQSISEMVGLNDRTIQLEEAFIEAEKREIEDRFQRKRKGMPYKEATQTLDFEEFSQMGFPNLLQALQGRVPGLSIRNSKVYLRGSVSLIQSSATSPENDGSALVLLNGIPVDASILNQTLPATVDFIDIIKGPRAAIYGSRAPNGVIVIFTKNGTEPLKANHELGGSLNFTHPGYDYSRKFYEPKYHLKSPDYGEPDYRTTLYWEPNIELNEDGKAEISFYTSDILGSYKIDMEGLTSEGKPIKATAYFEVSNEQ